MCLPYGGNKITQNCTRNTDARWRFSALSTSRWQISNIFMLHIILNLKLFQFNVETIIEGHFEQLKEVPFDLC